MVEREKLNTDTKLVIRHFLSSPFISHSIFNFAITMIIVRLEQAPMSCIIFFFFCVCLNPPLRFLLCFFFSAARFHSPSSVYFNSGVQLTGVSLSRNALVRNLANERTMSNRKNVKRFVPALLQIAYIQIHTISATRPTMHAYGVNIVENSFRRKLTLG